MCVCLWGGGGGGGVRGENSLMIIDIFKNQKREWVLALRFKGLFASQYRALDTL